MRLLSLSVLSLSLLHLAAPIAVMSILELTKTIVELSNSLLETWDVVNESNELIETSSMKRERLVFTKLDNINLRLEEISSTLNSIDKNIDIITRMLNDIPYELRLEMNLNDLNTILRFLNIYYKQMEDYLMNFNEYENSTLIEFGNAVVSSNPNSVFQMTGFVYSQITSRDFLQLLSRRFAASWTNGACNERQSLQQIFHNFLKEILVTMTKSHLVMQVAYIIKKLYTKNKFTKEIQDENEEFQFRINNIINVTKPYMAEASTSIWACDPKQHIRGETFIDITNFVHGYVVNKANLDPHGKCKQECDSYEYTEKITNCNNNQWCKEQPQCKKVMKCQFTDSSLNICKQNVPRDARRYQYIDYGNGRTLGKKSGCSSSNMRHLETYRDWIIWKCSHCFCICEEKETPFSDRYINLRTAKANITGNRVVTGIRFVKHNRIIHLQVQEGKLIENGKIDLDTVRWVPVDDYKLTDKRVSPGQDYHALSWEQRTIELEDIMADKDFVVTGVRFRRIGARLHLEVLTTPFNISTGQLTISKNIFQDDPDIQLKHKFGKSLKLTKPDIPTRSTIQCNVFTTKQHVDFTYTDYDKDAAQTTVPFFDAQPVISDVPVPLSGLGIFHKGRSGSGGFIAPRIFTYNFTEFLQPVVFP